MSGHGHGVLAALVLALGVACQGGGRVDFRVHATEGDTPYRGADRVVIAVERSGQVDPSSAVEFDADAAQWPVPDIDYGQDLRLRVEARAGSLVLARGRSFPFDMEGPEDRPSADVWLGSLGSFGAVHEGVAARGLRPRQGGAFGVDGTGMRFDVMAHGTEAGTLEVRHTPADLAGLAWFPGQEGALHGIRAERWVRLEAQSSLSERLETGYAPGSGVAAFEDGLLIARPDGVLLALIGEPGASTRRDVGRLAGPFDEVDAVPVPVGDTTRVVVLAGDALFVVDPTGDRPPSRVEGTAAHGAVLAPLAPGLVAVVGGVDAEGPVDEVLLLVLGGDRPRLLRPPPLFEARRNPAVVRLSEGLVLIAGGVGVEGALASAELFQVGLADLPGDVSVTGSLPFRMPSPRGTRLADGSVLIVGAEGCALYFDPRDPAP
ncbi:MAG: hypothetical protein AB8I08_11955 [Sandaracinaceae bacterium]